MARVSKLSVKGYRSINARIEIAFPPNKPVVLIGENNAGKSNIVRALNLMLGQYSPGYHEPEDHEYFGRDSTVAASVSVAFDEDDPLNGKWTELHWTCENGD